MGHHGVLPLVAAVSLCLCCGGTAPPPASPAGPPVTDSDPPPWTPTPERSAWSSGAVGLTMSGGHDQARSVARLVVQAIVDGDAAALERHLAPRIARMIPGVSSPADSAASVIRLATHQQRRANLRLGTPIEQLVELERIDVSPLSRHLVNRPIPPGLLPSDLYVVVPMTAEGRRFFRRLVRGWGPHGAVLVRPGTVPQVIGL